MSAAGSEGEDDDKALETVKFNFNIESLGLVLYNNHPTQVSFSLGFLCTHAQPHPHLPPTVASVLVPAAPGAAAPGRAQAGRVCSPSPEDLRETVGQRPTGGQRGPESLHAGRPEDGHGKGDVPVSSGPRYFVLSYARSALTCHSVTGWWDAVTRPARKRWST